MRAMTTEALISRLRADARRPHDDRRRYDAAFEILDVEEPLAVIVPLLADPDLGVRALAVWMIADFTRSDDEDRLAAIADVVPRLCQLAADLDAEVRRQAARALQGLTSSDAHRDAVEPVLVRLLGDPEPTVRVSVAFGLARLGVALDRVAAEMGAALLRPEPPLSNQHQEVCMMLTDLGRAAAPAVPGLLARLRSAGDPDLAVSIVEALGAAATPEATRALRELAGQGGQVGRAAGRALDGA